MKIVGEYSFNGGREFIEAYHAPELDEVKQVIAAVDSDRCRVKVSREKTMPGKLLYVKNRLGVEIQ